MSFSPATRGPVEAEALLWIAAKNKATGLSDPIGFWTGPENRTFNVDLQARDYIGAGAALEIPNIQSRIGVYVQSHEFVLSATKAEVFNAVRSLDFRQAPFELHSVRFDPDSKAITHLDDPLRGFVNAAPIREGRKGGTATVRLTVVSDARFLTQTLPIKKSHEQQKRRSGDQINKYADISGSVPVYWGMERQG